MTVTWEVFRWLSMLFSLISVGVLGTRWRTFTVLTPAFRALYMGLLLEQGMVLNSSLVLMHAGVPAGARNFLIALTQAWLMVFLFLQFPREYRRNYMTRKKESSHG